MALAWTELAQDWFRKHKKHNPKIHRALDDLVTMIEENPTRGISFNSPGPDKFDPWFVRVEEAIGPAKIPYNPKIVTTALEQAWLPLDVRIVCFVLYIDNPYLSKFPASHVILLPAAVLRVPAFASKAVNCLY